MSGSNEGRPEDAKQDTLRAAGKGIDAPRLTPQGRAGEDGEDDTSPEGGAKTGQPSKAEG